MQSKLFGLATILISLLAAGMPARCDEKKAGASPPAGTWSKKEGQTAH